MYRSILTISAVAAISCYLANFEQAQGRRPEKPSWVRTADGWESSLVLQVDNSARTEPTLHPALVASFQLGVSLFALMAFPSRVKQGHQPASQPKVKRVRVRGVRRKAAF